MEKDRHILLVDDNESIHNDIESILIGSSSSQDEELLGIEKELFGGSTSAANGLETVKHLSYDIDHAYQGEEALDMVQKADQEGYPYSLVFMDVRMPPGMDGVQAIKRIWKKYPYTEIVICTAYSDYSWNEIISTLGTSDKLLFMKKPFDATALKQTALTLTTKWRLQQEAIRHTDKLEKQVEERTKELTKLVADYKVMKEKAEKASAAKSEFLANVSHEIRTPMNGIIGMNSLLLESELTEEQKEYAKMIRYSADSLLNIINDILDLAKIEAGKMDLEEIPFNLKENMDELTKLIDFSSKENDVEVSLSVDDRLPEELIGDPMRIRQVLLNYGNNAIKFTKEGQVEFNVRLLEDKGRYMSVMFSVKDTGIGISESKQDQLFKPFTQADSSTTRKFGGTGLGLAICKQLSELMGGEVGVRSKEGEGSVFWFSLDLLKKANEEKDREKQEKSARKKVNNIDTKFSGNFRILVAEDNSINQMVAQRMLEQTGLRVDLASNGKEAVEAFKNYDYDLILMDVHMPELDGVEATRMIRELENGEKQLPIIALSASVMPRDKELIFDAGMDDFIGKPVEKHRLIQVLKHWLEDERNLQDQESSITGQTK